MPTTVTSTTLLQGLQGGGNEDAWGHFCLRYEPMLLACSRRAGLREEDARDVVQETMLTFVTAFREGKYDRDRGRLRSWLQGIAFNKIRQARDRLARGEVQPDDLGDATAYMNRVPDERAFTDIFEEEWERGVLAECVAEVQKEVDAHTFRAFHLYAVENRPAEEVASSLGISRNSVYISKTRVAARLRELYREIAEIW